MERDKFLQEIAWLEQRYVDHLVFEAVEEWRLRFAHFAAQVEIVGMMIAMREAEILA